MELFYSASLTNGINKCSPQSEINEAIEKVTKELRKKCLKKQTRNYLKAWLKVAKRGFRYKSVPSLLLFPGQGNIIDNCSRNLPPDAGSNYLEN